MLDNSVPQVMSESDEKFISLWHSLKSPTAVAKALAVDIRWIYRKRTTLEQKYGIKLATDHILSREQKLDIPDFTERFEYEVRDGVGVVFSDAHYWPDIITDPHKILVKVIEEVEPDFVIGNGDIMDGAQTSRHPRSMWEKQPNVKEELDATKARLAEIKKAAGNAHLIRTIGNHDDIRFDGRLSTQVGEYEGVPGMRLRDHLPDWQVCMSVAINNNTMVKHRYHSGIHAGYNNVLKSGWSILTGHTHRLLKRAYTDYNGTRYALETGTLADPRGPQFHYAEDGPKDWQPGFWVITYVNSELHPEPVEVKDGKAFFRGKFIHAQ